MAKKPTINGRTIKPHNYEQEARKEKVKVVGRSTVGFFGKARRACMGMFKHAPLRTALAGGMIVMGTFSMVQFAATLAFMPLLSGLISYGFAGMMGKNAYDDSMRKGGYTPAPRP